MSMDKEIERILTNPDNLIVSDSLKGRIDFGEEIAALEINVLFTAGDKIIPGRFRSYKISCENEHEQEIKISFACQENQLEKLLNIIPSAKCKVEIMENKIEGGLLGVSVFYQRAELVITVTLTRYI